MPFIFQRHYTRDQAEALLPDVRRWFSEIEDLRHRLEAIDPGLAERAAAGEDLGGDAVNRSLKLQTRLQELLDKFRALEIQIKDLDRWLIDFPAVIGGREVFLCWQRGEDAIEDRHDLRAGFAGRTPL